MLDFAGFLTAKDVVRIQDTFNTTMVQSLPDYGLSPDFYFVAPTFGSMLKFGISSSRDTMSGRAGLSYVFCRDVCHPKVNGESQVHCALLTMRFSVLRFAELRLCLRYFGT